MDKIYLNIIRRLKTFKRLVLSTINYCLTFFDRKKAIDKMYTNIIQDRTREIKILEENLRDIHNKNVALEKEITSLETSLNKKNLIISDLQDLLTKRVDN